MSIKTAYSSEAQWRVGHDFTFGAPMSVSVCFASVRAEERASILQAHAKALARAVRLPAQARAADEQNSGVL